jgi:cytochrome b involved in lipid metabolism
MEQVKANNTAASCWSAIDAVVYNLTNWIPLHPGGSYLIQMLCGTDGSAQFRGQHANASNPAAQLAKYRLGPLK